MTETEASRWSALRGEKTSSGLARQTAEQSLLRITAQQNILDSVPLPYHIAASFLRPKAPAANAFVIHNNGGHFEVHFRARRKPRSGSEAYGFESECMYACATKEGIIVLPNVDGQLLHLATYKFGTDETIGVMPMEDTLDTYHHVLDLSASRNNR